MSNTKAFIQSLPERNVIFLRIKALYNPLETFRSYYKQNFSVRYPLKDQEIESVFLFFREGREAPLKNTTPDPITPPPSEVKTTDIKNTTEEYMNESAVQGFIKETGFKLTTVAVLRLRALYSDKDLWIKWVGLKFPSNCKNVGESEIGGWYDRVRDPSFLLTQTLIEEARRNTPTLTIAPHEVEIKQPLPPKVKEEVKVQEVKQPVVTVTDERVQGVVNDSSLDFKAKVTALYNLGIGAGQIRKLLNAATYDEVYYVVEKLKKAKK